MSHAVMQADSRVQPKLPPVMLGNAARSKTRETGSVVALPGISSRLQKIGRIMHCERGRVVQEAGDPADCVYKVTEGTLRSVRLLPDGRRHIAKFLTAGDFFGFAEFKECTNSLEAITDCTLIRYPRRDFESILESDATAGRQLFGLICHQLEASNRLLLLLGRKTAAERMASFLLSAADPDKLESGAANIEISLPMSRADIADHLGLTIETVSRTVTKFRQQQWIRLLESNRILITAPEKLEDLAAD